MLELLTPDNLAEVLIAAGTGASGVLTAVGGWTLWKRRKEPPPPGSPDAVVVALQQNTEALKAMSGQFGENLKMFAAILKVTEDMAEDIEESRRLKQNAVEHLSAIRDGVNRRR